MPLRRNLDKDGILRLIRENRDLGQNAAECLRKRVEPYVPYNTGRLCSDVTVRPYEITYNAPYAGTVYSDLKRNFRKDKHPLAAARWDEAAMPAVHEYWVRDIQEFVDRMDFHGG